MRRCLIVTDGFYEWKKLDSAAAEAAPFGNRGPMLMAGFAGVRKSPDGWIRSCTIITTEANELVAKMHDRMPAIVAPDDYASLGEEPASPNQRKAMLRPYPADRLAHVASTEL